jgi:hypothetical protein
MATERPYADLTEAELREQVLGRPDRRLPPPDEARALLDEWVLRRGPETFTRSVERAGLSPDHDGPQPPGGSPPSVR